MKDRIIFNIIKEYKGILYITGGIMRPELFKFFRSSKKLFTKSELITCNGVIYIYYILLHKNKLKDKSIIKLYILLHQMKKFHKFAKDNYYIHN